MIFMLNASPRKTGVTTTLRKIIADEARSAGAEVEWIDVHNLSIRPCMGCLKCRPDKECILPKDDGHRIGKLIERCSSLVVATPTYWGNMTGPLKILFDRIVPVLEYCELYTNPQDLAEAQPLLRDGPVERLASHQLHDDEVDPVCGADLVDRDDVRVVEGGGGAGLLDEAGPSVRVRQALRRAGP